MKFSELAQAFSELEKVSSRLTMTELLAKLLKRAEQAEVDKICYLALGRLVPFYESLEFMLAEKMVVRAIGQAFGKEVAEVTKEYKQIGDLGEVVSKLKSQKSQPKASPSLKEKLKTKSQISKLDVLRVYTELKKIAEEGGEGSQERKLTGLAKLILELDGLSGKYVVRIVLKKMRLGFSTYTLLDALSWMEKGDKSLRKELEQAFFVRADVGTIARMFRAKGLKGLKQMTVKFGVPVMPALCQRLKTANEMIKKMGQVAVEPKFDGSRQQLHIDVKRKVIKSFTRNLEETRAMFPELERAYQQVKAREVILDSEAVGVDPKTGRLLSFQTTIQRKRKYGIEKLMKEVPIKFMVFDVLYKDGQDLLKRPLGERRRILEKLLRPGKVLVLTEQIVTAEADKLRQFHHKQLGVGLEGVVVKQIRHGYEPGRRAYAWVKFKEEETAKAGLADTLDCVVMGYYRGKGKRSGFGIGVFLVGVRGGGVIYTISKIGTGLSDEQWQEMKRRLEAVQVKEKPAEYEVNKGLLVDVWVEPAVVVEIAADNITKSPVHTAGYALRFPRLVRFRDDKEAEQATTVKEVIKLYRMQR